MPPRPEIPGFGADRCRLYLDGTAGAPPRPELVRAIALLGAPSGGRALDLGCGPGREAVELLRAGFRVTAVDPYPEMLERTRALAAAEAPSRTGDLEVVDATIEEIAPSLPAAAFRIVHAGFVLPFVLPAAFDAAFRAVRASVAPGGILACQFFGPDDGFIRTAAPGTMSGHSAVEVDALLHGMESLHREEVNRSGQVGRGREKWWHVHHVIARQP